MIGYPCPSCSSLNVPPLPVWVSSEVGSPPLPPPPHTWEALPLCCLSLPPCHCSCWSCSWPPPPPCAHACTFSFQFFIVLLIILLAELILLILFFVYMDKVSLQEGGSLWNFIALGVGSNWSKPEGNGARRTGQAPMRGSGGAAWEGEFGMVHYLCSLRKLSPLIVQGCNALPLA